MGAVGLRRRALRMIVATACAGALLAGCASNSGGGGNSAEIQPNSTTTAGAVEASTTSASTFATSFHDACDLFSDARSAAMLEVIGNPSNGPDAKAESTEKPYFTGSSSECYRTSGASGVIIAVYSQPDCHFDGVATDPTRQVSTSPNVFVAGGNYACGEIEGGHAVALTYGALNPTAAEAAVDAAWIEFFSL